MRPGQRGLHEPGRQLHESGNVRRSFPFSVLWFSVGAGRDGMMRMCGLGYPAELFPSRGSGVGLVSFEAWNCQDLSLLKPPAGIFMMSCALARRRRAGKFTLGSISCPVGKQNHGKLLSYPPAQSGCGLTEKRPAFANPTFGFARFRRRGMEQAGATGCCGGEYCLASRSGRRLVVAGVAGK